jgi:glyceraldehyde 3-phosphate dehydrogenase
MVLQTDLVVHYQSGGTFVGNFIRVGLNGTGRIAQSVLRAWINEWGGPKGGIKIVGINCSGQTPLNGLCNQFKRDTVHGDFPAELTCAENTHSAARLESSRHEPSDKSIGCLVVGDRKPPKGQRTHRRPNRDGCRIPVFACPDASDIPWSQVGADVVIDCTGKYTSTEKCMKHIAAGAKKVIIGAPAEDDTPTILYAVNQHEDSPKKKIISMASCTTGAVAPVMDVMLKIFGTPESVFLNTTHAITVSQNALDGSGAKDPMLARCADNIIPTTTGAAKSLAKIFPVLTGKSDGISMRVPVNDGSICHAEIELNAVPTADEINYAIYSATTGYLADVLDYVDLNDGVVSGDIIGSPYSGIFIPDLTKVIPKEDIFGSATAHIFVWYDNEYGYGAALLRLAATCLY